MLQAAFQATSQARKQAWMGAENQSIRLGACGPRASLSLLDHFPLRRERAVRRTPSLFRGHAMRPCHALSLVSLCCCFPIGIFCLHCYIQYNTIQYTLYTLYTIALSRSYFSFYSLLLVYRLALIIIHCIYCSLRINPTDSFHINILFFLCVFTTTCNILFAF